MRQLPGWEGIRGKALMHQSQRAFRQRVAQIIIEAANLPREQQPLIDHGARGEGRHIKISIRRQPLGRGQFTELVQRLLADGQDFAFKRILILDAVAGRNNRLADHRHAGDHGLAQAIQRGRDFAPAEQGLPFGSHIAFNALDRDRAGSLILRQETHGDRIAARRRQGLALAFGPVAQQSIGHLDQAARAITH